MTRPKSKTDSKKDDVKKVALFFKEKDKGEKIAGAKPFIGLTLKNRPATEMICDCCGSSDDCCGFN